MNRKGEVLQRTNRIAPLVDSENVSFEHAVFGEQVGPVLAVMGVCIIAIQTSQALDLFDIAEILDVSLKIG